MKPRYGHGKPPHGALYEIIDQQRGIYQDLLREAMGFEKYIAEIKDSTAQTDRSQPVWNNGFLPGLDIIGIYTLIARYRPSKYIEVGSGNSTKVAFKAKKITTRLWKLHPLIQCPELRSTIWRIG